MRAYAAAHLDYDDVLHIAWPDAEAIIQSEYTGGDDGRAYAVTLHGEIRDRVTPSRRPSHDSLERWPRRFL